MVRLRDRFKPDLTEREAARYMQGVIDNACENNMSIVYDQFQVSIQRNVGRPLLKHFIACSTSKTRFPMRHRQLVSLRVAIFDD